MKYSYASPENQPGVGQFSTETLQTLGHLAADEAVDTSVLPYLSAPNGAVEAAAADFMSAKAAGFAATKECFEQCNLSVAVPQEDAPEFAHVNWKLAELTYKVFSNEGLEPCVVVAPTGREIESWDSLYRRLFNELNSPKRTVRSFMNPLQLEKVIRDGWFEFVPKKLGWSVSILSQSDEACHEAVKEDWTTNNGQIAPIFTRLADRLPYEVAIENPAVETYLMHRAITLCAGRNVNDQPAMWVANQEFQDSYAMYATWQKYTVNMRTDEHASGRVAMICPTVTFD